MKKWIHNHFKPRHVKSPEMRFYISSDSHSKEECRHQSQVHLAVLQGTGVNKAGKTRDEVFSEITLNSEDAPNRPICVSVYGDPTVCICLSILDKVLVACCVVNSWDGNFQPLLSCSRNILFIVNVNTSLFAMSTENPITTRKNNRQKLLIHFLLNHGKARS